jgi:hypothetical protein
MGFLPDNEQTSVEMLLPEVCLLFIHNIRFIYPARINIVIHYPLRALRVLCGERIPVKITCS